MEILKFGDRRITGNHVGTRTEPEYMSKIDENGVERLERTGEINTYEVIQSHKEECTLQNIIQRYIAGDASALSARGFYADVADMPTCYSEMVQRVKDMGKEFDKLPAELRAKFDNDVQKFAATAGTAEWYEKLNINTQKNESEVVKEGADEQKQ